MAKHALLLGWNRAIPGYAGAAGELFNAWTTYVTNHVENGVIERFVPVIFNHGHLGDLNGFFLLEGDREKLENLRWTDDFQNLAMQTLHVVEGFRIIPTWVNEGTMEAMQRWGKYIK
ncbi:MAG: hypothetical protein KC503_27980 [Myxococcales bacterium]|nr:hypothetical protein [Myxococcales bacterium]